jgi:hypothetical protein
VLGPAGSGKTFALAAAARAWEDAGYRPLGAVVQGTATEVLRDATGMDCSTVASLLYRLDHELLSLDERSVVVVDESSTLGNRDLARLAGYVERSGAALRLVGDPAQHSAVAAGGAWRALLEHYPEDRPALSLRRRQEAPEMEAVRLASGDYAAGRISEAVERLRRDRRIVEADSPEELLDALVADWYVDRISRRVDPEVPPSSMMADHHSERRELNADKPGPCSPATAPCPDRCWRWRGSASRPATRWWPWSRTAGCAPRAPVRASSCATESGARWSRSTPGSTRKWWSTSSAGGGWHWARRI